MRTDEVRTKLVEFMQLDLVGPAGGEDEVLDDAPAIRYVAGVLFPQESERDESAAVSGVESEQPPEGSEPGGADDQEIDYVDAEDEDRQPVRSPESAEHDETVTLANTYRPSAIGLSFLVAPGTASLVVQARAALYASFREQDEGSEHVRTRWRRTPLSLDRVEILLGDGDRCEPDRELSPGLRLRVVVRPFRDRKTLLTVSLYNSSKVNTSSARTFFQVGLDVEASDGADVFPEYVTIDSLSGDPEEIALALLYRNRRSFAVGHGCAAEWDVDGGERATRLRTAVVPGVVVPPVLPRELDTRGLSMQFLSGDGVRVPATEIPIALEEVARSYETWIETREREVPGLPDVFHATARNHLELCRCALSRMRRGIQMIQHDQNVREAFMLANRVMLMQQHHSTLRRRLGDPWFLPEQYSSDSASGRGFWRAFQIAFVLVNLPGLVPGEEMVALPQGPSPARDIVDLIWFPTGGGKTEAYLAVTAFSIFTARIHRRERGCLVLMRYTLRLLTSQQFQRAASLICACEVVRRDRPDRLGSLPISIGLWVGASLTPNHEKDAIRMVTHLRERRAEAKNGFQLLSCPWCGTELDNPDHLGYADRGGRQIFLCPAQDCPFSERDRALPVCVVDDSVYAAPPTLLIGTVDKFALLAWNARAGSIFDIGGGPEVIIQDELHLIAGPLGSMVGLYESAIDYLCSRRGHRPKIIASTATIRRAADQCRALYDRPMFQFPPPGLDASDSWFAFEDEKAPGRTYVGILPTASSSPLTAQIRTVVALQQGVLLVAPPGDDEVIDPYWTLVQYFGSLKELGRAATFITADIPEFLPTMHRRWDAEGARRRFMNSSEELTSRKDEDEIPMILKRLEVRYRSGARGADQALDTVLATNMISVGVDIPRLGVMLVVTQPKGTSEYIQASSRVGRRHPGLVVTLYNAGRPRDRSHYEHFCSYHRSFYRFVEPTSVTPFSPPAMTRALHAVVVIGGRHVAGWSEPSDFDRDDTAFEDFLAYLRRRVEHIDARHLDEFDQTISLKLAEWQDNAPRRWGDLVGARDEQMLMRPAGTAATHDDPSSWATPTSMRNVDVECRAAVISRYHSPARGVR